jgi:hypothetical protein
MLNVMTLTYKSKIVIYDAHRTAGTLYIFYVCTITNTIHRNFILFIIYTRFYHTYYYCESRKRKPLLGANNALLRMCATKFITIVKYILCICFILQEYTHYVTIYVICIILVTGYWKLTIKSVYYCIF